MQAIETKIDENKTELQTKIGGIESQIEANKATIEQNFSLLFSKLDAKKDWAIDPTRVNRKISDQHDLF